ncbi:hypothetical protein ES703_100704 [subsurface metagenome]
MGIWQKGTALRAVSMYMLMNLNRCSDALAGEFINVDHMFHLNPFPNSGTEDFVFPRNSMGKTKEQPLLCVLRVSARPVAPGDGTGVVNMFSNECSECAVSPLYFSASRPEGPLTIRVFK